MRTPKYHEYILGFGNGSTVVHLDKLGIVNYKALLPSANVIEQFNSHVSVIRNSIELNIDENISLKETRDYLLSKLISGEIRVKEASKKVKEVL
jgi:type I restriction enzyme S subunit